MKENDNPVEKALKQAAEVPTKKEPKILISINTHRHMNPFFANSVFYMLRYMDQTGMKYEIDSHTGVSNLCGGRQARVDFAIKSNCTHMLLIDDDMVFGMDIIHKMLSEMNQLTVAGERKIAMGVNACRKSPLGLYYTAKGLDSDEFIKSKGKEGVEQVSRCGLGVFLIEIPLLREIPVPHFEIMWTPNASLYDHAQEMFDLLCVKDRSTQDWEAACDTVIAKVEKERKDKHEHQGEDFYFIKKLRAHGVKIFVDNDISQSIGHAGEFIYTYNSYKEP